jgi:hypothetical protein
MRFSIVLAVIMLAAFGAVYIQSTFGEIAPIVFGLICFTGVYLFFKYVVNA